MQTSQSQAPPLLELVKALGEEPRFNPGDRVRILTRDPVGHYRVPRYIRGKHAVIQEIIEPAAINNEEEGYGKNAGTKLHYYRVVIPIRDLWPDYHGSVNDALHIEVYENWLEIMSPQK